MDRGECGVQCSWTETLSDQRNSTLCDSEIQENTLGSELGGREESINLINDNLEENNKRVVVVAHRCSMVRIPLAEPGYTD